MIGYDPYLEWRNRQLQSQLGLPIQAQQWIGTTSTQSLQPHGIVTTWTMPSETDPLLPKKSFIQELREEINNWVKGIRA